jgi:hypothetical protein
MTKPQKHIGVSSSIIEIRHIHSIT